MSGNVFVLLLLFLLLDTGVAYQGKDITCVLKVLISHGAYKEKLIPYAAKVTSMDIHADGHFEESRLCGKMATYGFYDSTVWVDSGCKSRFKICYKLGFHLLVECTYGDDSYHKCELRSKRKIIRIAWVMYLPHSRHCKENENYGFEDNYVWVKNGCRAAFRVTIPYKNEGILHEVMEAMLLH